MCVACPDYNFLWIVVIAKFIESLLCSKIFTCIYLCNSYNNIWGSYYYYDHLTDEEIAQSHIAGKTESNPGNLTLDPPALKECLLMMMMKKL